jgi:hypothetical protein
MKGVYAAQICALEKLTLQDLVHSGQASASAEMYYI